MIISENTRKKLSDNLKSTLGTLEESQNQIYNQNMKEEIFGHQILYMQDQFKILHHANQNIDKKEFETLKSEIYIKEKQIKESTDQIERL